MRYDVTEKQTLQKRLGQLDGEDHFRVVAELEGRIVGDATMDREVHAWTRHVAQIRGVVVPEFREKGLATLLFRELTGLAEEVGIERLFAEVMGDDKAVIETLKKAGFDHETKLDKFAKDIKGNLHDLIIMTNDLTLVWKHLEDELLLMDIQMPG
jgi:RimJ/RimL family protein N-acetyltransferase